MEKTKYPKIHLVIDNCFAIKRWVEPNDWMRIVSKIGGVANIQASTDNEIDPPHSTREFREAWVKEVKKCEREYGLKVVSFYSGYAQYRTVGIASAHESKRRTMIKRYFEPVVNVASKLKAQVGNTLGAYADPVLQNPKLYAAADDYVEQSLVEMTRYAARKGVIFGYEQMYTPMQGMWTIEGCIARMRNVTAKAGAPMYITIDTAHQAKQHLFQRPSVSDIKEMQKTGDMDKFRLPDAIIASIRAGDDPKKIADDMDEYAYWFADQKDTDLYEWLKAVGCYSPIIHLQQTDGTFSAHRPFTKANNETGIVHPKKVFAALAKSYDSPPQKGMPPKVSDIYLAFELFFGAEESTEYIIRAMRESVLYWREYLPKDGVALDQLI